MAANNLKVGDLVRYGDSDFLLGIVMDIRESKYGNFTSVLHCDGLIEMHSTSTLKRYTVDRSLNKVIISLIKTLENSEEWIDHELAADYFMESFMESMNEENNKKVGD